MILANLTKAIREQNYYAVVLEFLIVIAGVVIGFQIQGWSEDQKEQDQRQRLLAELIDDIEADVTELEIIQGYAERRMVAISDLLDSAGTILRRDHLDDLELRNWQQESHQFGMAGSQGEIGEYDYPITTNFISTYDGNQHTYHTLINSGDIHLFEDRSLTRAIQEYYFFTETLRDFENLALVSSRDAAMRSVQRNGISRLGQTSLDEFVDVIMRDPELEAQLSDFWFMSFQHAQRCAETRQQAISLLVLLRGTLS